MFFTKCFLFFLLIPFFAIAMESIDATHFYKSYFRKKAPELVTPPSQSQIPEIPLEPVSEVLTTPEAGTTAAEPVCAQFEHLSLQSSTKIDTLLETSTGDPEISVCNAMYAKLCEILEQLLYDTTISRGDFYQSLNCFVIEAKRWREISIENDLRLVPSFSSLIFVANDHLKKITDTYHQECLNLQTVCLCIDTTLDDVD